MQIIFVMGTAFSGSTMSDLLLGNTHTAVSLGEVYAVYRPFRPHHLNPTCGCGDVQCERWRRWQRLPPSEAHASISAETGADVLVDSSKNMTWMIDVMRWNRGLTFRIATSVKSPRQFAESSLKRGGEPDFRAYSAYYERLLRTGASFRTAPIDDVTRRTEEVIGLLRTCAGIPFEMRDIDIASAEPHHYGGNKGMTPNARSSGVETVTEGAPVAVPPSASSMYEALLDLSILNRGDWPATGPVSPIKYRGYPRTRVRTARRVRRLRCRRL